MIVAHLAGWPIEELLGPLLATSSGLAVATRSLFTSWPKHNGQVGARPFAEVLSAVQADLIERPGVHAVGEGVHDGEPCIVVLADPLVHDTLPSAVDGYAVVTSPSDEVRATPGADPVPES